MSNKEFTFDFEEGNNDLDFTNDTDTVEDATVEEPEDAKDDMEENDEEAKAVKELHNSYLIIYDSIMFEDKYEKTVNLGKKYSATFSTRSTDSDMNISRQLDKMKFSTMHALQTMSAVITMSYSLMELNGTDLRNMSVPERYNFIRMKSSHLIEKLSSHMIDFDSLVRKSLAYGEQNF